MPTTQIGKAMPKFTLRTLEWNAGAGTAVPGLRRTGWARTRASVPGG